MDPRISHEEQQIAYDLLYYRDAEDVQRYIRRVNGKLPEELISLCKYSCRFVSLGNDAAGSCHLGLGR